MLGAGAGSLLLTVPLSCLQVPSRRRTARSALCLEERTAEGMAAQHSKVSGALALGRSEHGIGMARRTGTGRL